MENLVGQLKVKSIIFESNDSEVLVKGEMEKGILSYDGELIISQSQLNQLICEMNKHSEKTIFQNEIFQSEPIGPNETLYYADFQNAPKVSLAIFQNSGKVKQIRA